MRTGSGPDLAILHSLLAIHPEPFFAACRILQKTDMVPLLTRLHAPTPVDCGEMDQATPPALNRQIAEQVKEARDTELPGCGHCPPLVQPEAFLGAIKEFIEL